MASFDDLYGASLVAVRRRGRERNIFEASGAMLVVVLVVSTLAVGGTPIEVVPWHKCVVDGTCRSPTAACANSGNGVPCRFCANTWNLYDCKFSIFNFCERWTYGPDDGNLSCGAEWAGTCSAGACNPLAVTGAICNRPMCVVQ